jgi:hypothetical protein
MPADGDLLSDRDFEIQHTRDRVELLLHARHGATGPSVEAITARLRGSATASIDSVVIARALATHARSPQVPLLTTMGYPHVPPSAVPP